MTVAELIEELKKLDQTLQVQVYDEDGRNPAKDVNVLDWLEPNVVVIVS